MVNTKEVLHTVNAVRVACGAMPLGDLPRGVVGSSKDCPLARAFRDVFPHARVGGNVGGVPRERAGAVATVLGTNVSRINGEAEVQLPAHLSKFVQEFDAGNLPQYRA